MARREKGKENDCKVSKETKERRETERKYVRGEKLRKERKHDENGRRESGGEKI